jgi:hypothetical protein
MTKTVDFDSFRAEQNEEPIIFIIDKEQYFLPGSIPASLAVDVIRMQTKLEDDDEVPTEQVDSFGRSLFGPTIWELLLRKHRITVTELSPLLERVMQAYTDDPKEEPALPATTDSTSTPESASA